MDLRAILAAALGAADGAEKKEHGHINLGDQWTVNLARELGRGAFGTVYKGRHRLNKGVVAVKRMKIPNDRKGMEAMREIKNFQKLDSHPNIIYLYDFHYRDQCFWMIMEFCDGGDLGDFMKTRREADVKYDIMMQCAAGLAHMHCQAVPIVHRDIKPANILMRIKDGQNTVKITDFGLSKIVDPETMVREAMFSTVCGTPGYMAPEMFKQVEYGPAVDVFAIGLVYVGLLYVNKTGDMLPLSINARKTRNVLPIGQEMLTCAHMNKPQPELVEDDAHDDIIVKQVKQLIRSMTLFEPAKRHSMRIVEKELSKIFNRSYVPREVKSGMPLFNRRAEEGDESASTANEGATGGAAAPEAVDVGFQFLRDALGSKRDARLEGMEEGKKTREMARLAGMNLMELMEALINSDDEGSAELFELGDRVRVKPDTVAAEAEKLQAGHGEWSERMIYYFGQVGYVKQSSHAKVVVKFRDGENWIWNPVLVERFTGEEPAGFPEGRHATVASLFRPNDIVRTPGDKEVLKCLQEVIGMRWTDKMERTVDKTGIVHKIDRDGDVVLELVNGLSGPFNPEALTHVRHPESVVIEAGDMVLVKEDRDEVRRLQDGHGGWHTNMAQALGHAGIVQKLMKGGRAFVEVGAKTWHFNAAALNLVIKGDELFAEMRR